MKLSRRNLITGTASLVGMTQLAIANEYSLSLPILPLTDLLDGLNQRIKLNLETSTHDFGNGVQSATYGISNPYLGPVLRAKKGQTIPFDIKNNLKEVSTLHWHGLHIPGEVDGGPHQQIMPGDVWKPDLSLTQRASTNWFHSHVHGKTAKQVYKGLVGMFLIEDDESLFADLPNKYGIDDFTIVLQDKIFDSDGKLSYKLSETAIDDGFIGETLIINGAIAPVEQFVPKGLVRLRLLNASNANFLTISMDKGPLNIIASDGGFLASNVQSDTLFMSPGERYEILVDMRKEETNKLFVSYELPEIGNVDDVFRNYKQKGLAGLFAKLWNEGEVKVPALTLIQKNKNGFDGDLPDKLANLTAPDRTTASSTRTFKLTQYTGADLGALAAAGDDFCGQGNAMEINGSSMDLDRIDEKVRKGETEIWRISVDDWRHPFHVHGCSFKILTQEGEPPPVYAEGWKDMVHVDGEVWSEILVRFDHFATEQYPYMYHCHILEHEDCGMMGQFTVT